MSRIRPAACERNNISKGVKFAGCAHMQAHAP